MNNPQLLKILTKDLNFKKRLFESDREFIERACEMMIKSLTGTRYKIIDSFEALLKRALIKIARERVVLKKGFLESEHSYNDRCLAELRRIYNNTVDDRLLIIQIYSNRLYVDDNEKKTWRNHKGKCYLYRGYYMEPDLFHHPEPSYTIVGNEIYQGYYMAPDLFHHPEPSYTIVGNEIYQGYYMEPDLFHHPEPSYTIVGNEIYQGYYMEPDLFYHPEPLYTIVKR